jgi:hypothetical protein
MKAALIFLAIVLVGCAAAPEAQRMCPPLPEVPARATPEQWANHYAVVIRLYAQCAGASTGDHQ